MTAHNKTSFRNISLLVSPASANKCEEIISNRRHKKMDFPLFQIDILRACLYNVREKARFTDAVNPESLMLFEKKGKLP